MATTEHFYTGDGSTSSFSFTFPYLKNADVKVQLDAVEKTESTHYNISNTNIVFTSGNIPASGVDIHIFRLTDVDTPQAVFAAGSSIKAGDLNNNQTQNLYSNQEQTQLYRTDRIKDSSITSVKILDGTIVNADVNASAAIAGTKISPDFGSQNIATTGTVDGRDVSVDGTKLDTIETNAKDDQTASEIKTLYESNAQTNAYTDSEKTFVNAITSTATELNTLDGITSTTAELNYVDGVTSGIQAQIDGKQPLDSELTELATMGVSTASSLADLTATEVQILDGATASTAELNLLSGKSIVTSIGGSATDVQIPSAQAVNERIVELVTEVGGFAPITNETSFPTTNPDINDGAGTIVSIKALASNLVANSSGVATIANGAGTGNTVTINGMGNAQTITAGKGLLVETTSTLHTYTFHREAIDGTGITNASVLVSDFNDRYQISGSPPSSHPDGSALGDGDLWFDTSANVMKVYDLGNTQYDAVTSVGDFKLLTVVPDGATSGSPTFNGSIVSYDFRDGSNTASITSAGQLIVSLNGVIQKPNAGSYNASNEGFYLEGTNGIKFCTAPPSGSSLFVTQCGSAVGIGVPNDNTVSTAKIQSGAITNAHVAANAAIDASKIANLTTDAITEGNSKAEVIGSGTNDGEFKVTLQDATSNGAGATSLRQYTNGSYNVTELNEGNKSINSSLIFNHLTGTNYGSNILFKRSGASTGESQIRCMGGSSFEFFPVDGNAMLTLNNTASTFQNLVQPYTDSTYDLGTNTNRWRNVYADTLYGDGSNLTGLQAGATGGNSGGNAIFWENQQTVTHDYSISANRNAGSFGPITINNGVTVTVPSTSNWTIV